MIEDWHENVVNIASDSMTHPTPMLILYVWHCGTNNVSKRCTLQLIIIPPHNSTNGYDRPSQFTRLYRCENTPLYVNIGLNYPILGPVQVGINPYCCIEMISI